MVQENPQQVFGLLDRPLEMVGALSEASDDHGPQACSASLLTYEYSSGKDQQSNHHQQTTGQALQERLFQEMEINRQLLSSNPKTCEAPCLSLARRDEETRAWWTPPRRSAETTLGKRDLGPGPTIVSSRLTTTDCAWP